MKTFKKDVDLRSRKAMVDFLENHFRYYTMNSCNRSTSYANNVKIYNLGIEDKEIENMMDNLAYEETPFDLRLAISRLENDFLEETGYTVGFNGRSGGYLVMYETRRNENGSYSTYPGRDIDQYADFNDKDEWSMRELKDRVLLVTKFDELCDNILAAYIDFCKTHKKVTKKETRIVEVTRYVRTDGENDE